ncbi:MAG TPA: DUF3999 family protein [Desulfomonilaceae bacterium]|nr:DUF3999 family protein [Desulfomonilaceae bacterium]
MRNVLFTCLCIAVTICLLHSIRADANEDLSKWTRFKVIQASSVVADGLVRVPLESGILEKCRSDWGDLRIISADGTVTPFHVEEGKNTEGSAPIPAKVFKVVRTPGKWTDMWIDKTTKFLSSGVMIQTTSKDFVRKVEIRGSDNGRDSYIIRMDALVADIVKPLAVSSLDVVHPLNNFQYIHLRILDGDLPPLKIDGASCIPPDADSAPAKRLDMRIMENRPDPGTGSTVVIGDLGEKRFPLTRLTLAMQDKDFVTRVTVHSAGTASTETWKKVCEGTVFRLHKEDAVKEKLAIPVQRELGRYIKITVPNGGRQAATITNVEALAVMPSAIFEYRKGNEYRLLYGNPKASPEQPHTPAVELTRGLATAPILDTGEERKFTAFRHADPAKPAEKAKKSGWGKILGIMMVALGSLLLFSLILRARSLRRARRSRIMRSRVHY